MSPAPDETPARGEDGTAARTRLAAGAFALASTTDLAALVDVLGESACASAGGHAWRFYALDPQNGALHAGAGEGPIVLPAPRGALESLLRHETPGLGGPDDPDAPWARPGAVVLRLPVRSGSTLRGALLIALDAAPAGGLSAPGIVVARVLADQCALALERGALEAELAGQRERMARLEQQAHTGEELFSELISVVAHEIRTPLTSIKAYTEALIDAPADEFERRRDFLHVIDEECDRLSRLVGDALDLSRLEAGLRLLKVRPVSPGALLADVALTVEPDAQRQGVVIQVESAEAPDEVEADGDLVKQLLLNLVGNAIKFSPRGSTVTLRATGGEGEGGDWRIAVADQGGGIPEDLIEKIFERFYRIETKGGRRAPGTGLGLAIARHIVDLHGGTLGVENAATGGSVFSVRLPRRQLAPPAVREVAADLFGRSAARELLDTAVGTIGEVMAADIVSILLVDPVVGDLVVAASRGLDETARARRMHFRGGVAGAVLAAGRPVLVENIETDQRFAKKSHPQYSTKSLLCAPLRVGGVHVGTVNVNNKRTREEFSSGDLDLLTSLVARLSAVLSRAHAYPDAPEVLAEARASVQSAARVERDLWLDRAALATHARRVAAAMGLSGSAAGTVARLAAGDGESPWDGDAGARAMLLARAERLDGTGWPLGLTVTQIPLGGRILAVIDEFERLTGGRPYRTALTVDEALAALRAEAGHRLDGDVIEALAASLAGDGWGANAPDADGAADAREEAA